MSDIVLSAGVRSNLLQLQQTSDLITQTQTRLATGKKVNSALDNPINFFTAQGLTVRLEVRDIRFARQRFDVVTDDQEGPKEVNLALQLATIIEGRALAGEALTDSQCVVLCAGELPVVAGRCLGRGTFTPRGRDDLCAATYALGGGRRRAGRRLPLHSIRLLERASKLPVVDEEFAAAKAKILGT